MSPRKTPMTPSRMTARCVSPDTENVANRVGRENGGGEESAQRGPVSARGAGRVAAARTVREFAALRREVHSPPPRQQLADRGRVRRKRRALVRGPLRLRVRHGQLPILQRNEVGPLLPPHFGGGERQGPVRREGREQGSHRSDRVGKASHCARVRVVSVPVEVHGSVPSVRLRARRRDTRWIGTRGGRAGRAAGSSVGEFPPKARRLSRSPPCGVINLRLIGHGRARTRPHPLGDCALRRGEKWSTPG